MNNARLFCLMLTVVLSPVSQANDSEAERIAKQTELDAACAATHVRCRTHVSPPGTARQRQEVEEPDQRPSQAPPTKATPDAATTGMPATATPQRTRSPPQHKPDASRTKV